MGRPSTCDPIRYNLLPSCLLEPSLAPDLHRARAVSELESGELRITIDGTEKAEQINGRTTYDHQLEAFVPAVLGGEQQPTGGQDAIANMRVIDAI